MCRVRVEKRKARYTAGAEGVCVTVRWVVMEAVTRKMEEALGGGILIRGVRMGGERESSEAESKRSSASFSELL